VTPLSRSSRTVKRPVQGDRRLLGLVVGAWAAIEAILLLAGVAAIAFTLANSQRSSTSGAPVAGALAPAESAAGQGTLTDPRVEAAVQSLATDRDRVGQLLLLGWAGSTAEAARPALRDLRAGGIVFLNNARTAADATAINATLPALAREHGLLPPLIAVDHEGGPVPRVEDVPNLGSNRAFATSGATARTACERGQEHARQLRAMGFNMNLAPVLDVNNNPANPVIGARSYGADPALVAELGSAYVRGLQGGGVIAVGKHFPGHGNTSVDSHLDLPVLPHGVDELEQVELVPFRRAVQPDTRVAAIMSAHIAFPALDPSGAPSTLSPTAMTGLLRDRLGFDGLAVTDDLAGMRAITDRYTPGQAAVRAVQAGVDLLIIAGDLARQQASRDALLAALDSGDLPRARLDEAVRRVLAVKARFGLLDGATPTAACG
jgi:beta-N-acetylhexosaminidase